MPVTQFSSEVWGLIFKCTKMHCEAGFASLASVVALQITYGACTVPKAHSPQKARDSP